MQRKNSILRKRNGFAMMMAIGVLVVIATLLALSHTLSSTTTKRTIDSYIKKQAELYAKNSAEYILYKISKASDNCLPNDPTIEFDLDNAMYHVSIDVDYAYSNQSCTDSNGNDNNYVHLQPMDSNATKYAYVKIRVYVDVDSNSINSEPIRITRTYLEDITEYIH